MPLLLMPLYNQHPTPVCLLTRVTNPASHARGQKHWLSAAGPALCQYDFHPSTLQGNTNPSPVSGSPGPALSRCFPSKNAWLYAVSTKNPLFSLLAFSHCSATLASIAETTNATCATLRIITLQHAQFTHFRLQRLQHSASIIQTLAAQNRKEHSAVPPDACHRVFSGTALPNMTKGLGREPRSCKLKSRLSLALEKQLE